MFQDIKVGCKSYDEATCFSANESPALFLDLVFVVRKFLRFSINDSVELLKFLCTSFY